jgi:hypothetical protein
MKPSDFLKEWPWDSVFQNRETEQIARNILVVMKRCGDTWERPTWLIYKKHREADGNFSQSEREYFDKAYPYLKSEDTTRLFSPVWGKLK